MPPDIEANKIKLDFLRELRDQGNLTSLFEHLSDIYFFAKNRKLQFVMCNQSFAAKCGVHYESEILGKTDYDFFPSDLAKNYNMDDMDVMDNGKRIVNRVELVPNEDGTVDWHSTNKEPLYSGEGGVVGIAGTTRNLKKAGALLQPYMEMSSIIDYISRNHASQIDIKKLAKKF